MTTANEALRDALIRHQIGLLRVSRRIVARIVGVLDRTEDELASKIRRAMARAPDGTTPANVRRLEALLGAVREIRSGAWREASAAWADEIAAVAAGEPDFLRDAVIAAAPVVVETASADAQRLRAAAMSQPFEGRTLREWARSTEREDIRRIHHEIRQGLIQGEPAPQIARRVVGTVRRRGADGVTQVSRRNAEAITRTAVNHVSNYARARALETIGDGIIEREQYVATLDARTTAVCQANDGKLFPVGKGPRPPLHWNCRSLRVPYLDGAAVGERPANAATRSAALRDYARENGLGRVSQRADLPRGHKGAFDRFERAFVRERTGQVPAATSYQEWLGRQSAEFQDDVLGKARGRLFRRGGLKLDRFVNRQGDELTLAELARRDADAFRAAGLDPAEYV